MEEKQIEQTETAPQSEFLPESLKDVAALQKFKDVEGLAKGYISLEKELGGRIKLPDFESGSEEDLNKFWSKLGRPEKSDGYTVDGLENADDFKNAAHKAGLSVKQAQAVADLFKNKKLNNADDYSQEGANKLAEQMFGDRKIEVVQKAETVLKSVLSEEEQAEFNKLENKAVAAVYKAIDKLYNLNEGKIIPPAGGQVQGILEKPDYTQYAKDMEQISMRPHSKEDIERIKLKNHII